MDVSIYPVCFVAVILFFCSALQSAVGFAFTLFGTPLLLMAGLPLPDVVMLALLASTLQKLLITTHLRGEFSFRALLPMVIVMITALPLGIAALKILAGVDKHLVKQWIGVLILGVVLLQWLLRIPPREKVASGWGFLAAFFSGFLSGLANIGGPPLVLWAHAHSWTNARIRVIIPAIALPTVPIQFVMMLYAFGLTPMPPVRSALVFIPVVVAGAWAGHKIGKRIKVDVLRVTANILLILTSLLAVFSK